VIAARQPVSSHKPVLDALHDDFRGFGQQRITGSPPFLSSSSASIKLRTDR
jgi:hypothetical protein